MIANFLSVALRLSMTSYQVKSSLNGTKNGLYVLITKMETFVKKTTQCCCKPLYTAGRCI